MNMLQIFKRFLCVALIAASGQAAWAFALLGPIPGSAYVETPLPASFGDDWQTLLLGYNMPYIDTEIPGGPVWLGDVGGPKNIGEEYRRNIPVIYYSYDANFLGFFGPQGEAAADQAVAIMNQAFTNNPTGTLHGLDT